MSHSLYRLAGALAAAAVASQTAAQAPQPSPYAPPPPPGGATITATLPAPPFRPRFYLGMGYDIGGDTLFDVTLSNGTDTRNEKMRANGGIFFNLGGDFLPLADGLLHTRATIGYKFDSIEASNVSIKYRTFPVEVIEFLNFAPLRLGAGLSLALQPRVTASGFLNGTVDAENSFGLAILGEYEVKMGGGGGLVLGPRFVVQKLRAKDGGATSKANSFGFYMAWLP